jgi:hypothetical protein
MKAKKWYRSLLACYPAAFREQYTEEMAEIFDQNWSKSQAMGDRVRYSAHMLWDWVRSMATEWNAALSWGWWLTLALLGTNLALDLFTRRYYSVAIWALMCLQGSLGGILLSRFNDGSKTKLIVRLVAIGAAGFFAPRCFHALADLGSAQSEWAQVRYILTTLCISGISLIRYLNLPTAPGDQMPNRMPKLTVSPLFLWSWSLLTWGAVLAGACYFDGHRALVHSSATQLAFISLMLVQIIWRVYYLPEASATYREESELGPI